MQERQLRVPTLDPLQDIRSNGDTIHTPLTTSIATGHIKCGCSINPPVIAQTFDYYGEVSSEPLEQLAAVVELEIARIQLEYLWYGVDLDLTAVVDRAAGAVVIIGDGLRFRRPRRMLESRISQAGLRSESHAADQRITVFPASQGQEPASRGA